MRSPTRAHVTVPKPPASPAFAPHAEQFFRDTLRFTRGGGGGGGGAVDQEDAEPTTWEDMRVPGLSAQDESALLDGDPALCISSAAQLVGAYMRMYTTQAKAEPFRAQLQAARPEQNPRLALCGAHS